MRHFPGLLALAAAALAAAVAQPARASLLVSVDKTAQQMTVTIDGDPRYIWPVSTGRDGYDTPGGQYTPFRMERDHFSREWDDAPMPYSIFFTKQGHAIHGTNHKIDGSPESHGCVRLSVAHASQLWTLVKAQGMANVRVELSGRIPSRGELMARREQGSDLNDDRARGNDPIARGNAEGDATGDIPPSQQEGTTWHAYVENGQVYYYRDGPEEIRREPTPRPRHHVRRYYRYYRGFPFW